MDTLQISTGEKRIPVQRDGVSVGELVFNPNNVLFAEKFYRLVNEFQEQFTQYKTLATELDENTKADANGLPVNMGERLALLKEASDFIKAKIDALFGDGVSQMVFGNAIELEMFMQFFNGITPHIQKARTQKVAQYITPKKTRNGKHPR